VNFQRIPILFLQTTNKARIHIKSHINIKGHFAESKMGPIIFNSAKRKGIVFEKVGKQGTLAAKYFNLKSFAKETRFRT
jgi:hypothetical protein